MDVQKLAKVLALAASDNEVEAVHALRTARRLLDAHGSDFVELARRVAEGAPAAPDADGVETGTDALEDAIFDLRNEIRHLRCENERLKQGRGPAASPQPPSFHDAARDVAAAIRLRAELAALTDTLEAGLRQAVQESLAEAGQLAARLSQAESRRMRLEAENRRLLHASHALGVELEELKNARAAADRVTQDMHPDFGGKRPKARVSAKAKGAAGQFALF